MKRLRVRTSNYIRFRMKILMLLVALTISMLSLNILKSSVRFFPATLLVKIFVVGIVLSVAFGVEIVLTSRFSPVRYFRLRKKLQLFTEMFTKQLDDGNFKLSIEWCYEITKDKTIVDFYTNGLVKDKTLIGRQLSEYLRMNILKYEELSDCTRLILGTFPKRYDGLGMMMNGKL